MPVMRVSKIGYGMGTKDFDATITCPPVEANTKLYLYRLGFIGRKGTNKISLSSGVYLNGFTHPSGYELKRGEIRNKDVYDFS